MLQTNVDQRCVSLHRHNISANCSLKIFLIANGTTLRFHAKLIIYFTSEVSSPNSHAPLISILDLMVPSKTPTFPIKLLFMIKHIYKTAILIWVSLV